MMRVHAGVALAVALGLLAGCAEDPDPPVARAHLATIPHPQNVDPQPPCLGFAGNAAFVAAGSQALGPSSGVAPMAAVAYLEVPEGVSALVLDLTWSHGATTGVRSRITGPGLDDLSPPRSAATPGDPLRQRLDDPLPGKYTWEAVADGVAAGVVVRFHEGLYYEDPDGMGLQCNP